MSQKFREQKANKKNLSKLELANCWSLRI